MFSESNLVYLVSYGDGLVSQMVILMIFCVICLYQFLAMIFI